LTTHLQHADTLGKVIRISTLPEGNFAKMGINDILKNCRIKKDEYLCALIILLSQRDFLSITLW
jgi:hypothetical protein